MTPPKGNQNKVRVAVVGAGDFGRNHARVYRELEGAELAGIVDANPARAEQVAKEFSTEVFPDIESLAGRVDAASVAVPTIVHARVGCRLLELGIDVLVEKPMAASLVEADELLSAAGRASRILQVGHLERFNPGIVAVMPAMNHPLYFEVHRLGVFTPRSLDIDVVYDVMIHDLDILLALVISQSEEALAKRLLISRAQAAKVRRELDARYCLAFRWLDVFRKEALQNGFVSHGERRKYLEGLQSSDMDKRNQGLNAAVKWLVCY